jgi:hypothetical protein
MGRLLASKAVILPGPVGVMSSKFTRTPVVFAKLDPMVLKWPLLTWRIQVFEVEADPPDSTVQFPRFQR